MKRQTTEKTPPTPAADMPERVLAELDRHLAELEIADKRLAAEEIAFLEDNTVPIEPTAAQIRLQDRVRSFMNGYAPEVPGLNAGEKMWLVLADRKAIRLAIEAGQNSVRRASIKLIAGALAAHAERMRPILSRTLWLIAELQAANRARAASCEAAMAESRGTLDYRAVPWRAFDLLGVGGSTGATQQSGESYEFAQLCEREGIKPKEIG